MSVRSVAKPVVNTFFSFKVLISPSNPVTFLKILLVVQ